jgi:hypothetical protein
MRAPDGDIMRELDPAEIGLDLQPVWERASKYEWRLAGTDYTVRLGQGDDFPWFMAYRAGRYIGRGHVLTRARNVVYYDLKFHMKHA